MYSLAHLASLAPAVMAVPSGFASRHPLSAPYLNHAAQAAGKLFFGTATAILGPEQSNRDYMTILNDTMIWGQLTPTDYMKASELRGKKPSPSCWVFTEPEQHVFNFTGGDVVLDIAEDNGQLVRCHNLVWEQELPDWVSNGNWTNKTLTAAMKVHIETLVEHWAGRCFSWDVVNEALNEDGTYAPNIFYNTIGAAYVPLAFEFASVAVKKTGADIKLFYNDFNIESTGPKNTGAQTLVRELQNRGIQIDGVGFESHFIVGEAPSMAAQLDAMQAIAGLGVEIQRTEIDVRFTTLPPSANGTNSYAHQASDYYDTIASCMALNACTGMTVWDFDDQYSWISSTYPGQGQADLYDADFDRKPAYLAVWQAIKGDNCTVCNTS